MFCAISNTTPEHPVVSTKSGHLFERSVIEKAIEATGRCPVTNAPLSAEDLLPVQLSTPMIKPRTTAAASIPGMLSLLQNEWDALMLELHALKTQLETTRQELGHALYQHDAACRVIARLVKERDEARQALIDAKPVPAQPITQPTAQPIPPPAAPPAAVGGLNAEIVSKLDAKNKELSKGRKKRSVEGVASAEKLAAMTTLSSTSMHTPSRTCVSFHSSLPLIATGGGDGCVRLYDSDSAKPTHSLGGSDGRVRRVLLHPTRPLVLGGGDDGIPRVWGTEQGDAVITYDNVHSAAVSGLTLQATGDYFVSASVDGSWCLLDLATTQAVMSVGGSTGYSSAELHPDGLILATGVVGAVKLWDVKSQNNVASFDGHEGSVGCLSFSENGYYLATGDAREVKLWDLRKLKTFKSIAAPAAVADVAFDHSGLFLAVGAGDEATVHETKTWAQLTKLDVSATGVAFGPKAKQLAISTADGKLQIYGGA